MEVLNNLVEQYSATNLYFAIFGLLLITSLGMFPGNTDIFMLMLGTLAATGVLSVEKIIVVAFSALFIGESVAFLLALRFVPILRPVNIAMVASLSHRPKSYYGMHVLLLAAYVPVNILIAMEFSGVVGNLIG